MKWLFSHLSIAVVLLGSVPLASDQNSGPIRQSWTYWDSAKTHPKTLDSYGRYDGLQNSTTMSWYENGQPKSEMLFNHGLPLVYIAWYDNGQQKIYETFDMDGLGHGTSIWWDLNGKVLAKSEMVHGTGVEYFFSEDGTETKRIIWVGGVKMKEETP
jgi:antitoxin component YwqK of YwqJK toxin-antitoxin module